METPPIVSPQEWLAARKELLVKEKELTRMRDLVNAERRRLPMVRIDKPYTFEGPNGTVGLLDLFVPFDVSEEVLTTAAIEIGDVYGCAVHAVVGDPGRAHVPAQRAGRPRLGPF